MELKKGVKRRREEARTLVFSTLRLSLTQDCNNLRFVRQQLSIDLKEAKILVCVAYDTGSVD